MQSSQGARHEGDAAAADNEEVMCNVDYRIFPESIDDVFYLSDGQ